MKIKAVHFKYNDTNNDNTIIIVSRMTFNNQEEFIKQRTKVIQTNELNMINDLYTEEEFVDIVCNTARELTIKDQSLEIKCNE